MNALDKIAYDKATNALKRGFDWQAYILLCAVENRTSAESGPRTVDMVPESQIDENIEALSDEFVRYMAVKRKFRSGESIEKDLLQSLDEFLAYTQKIIAELYASADLEDEKIKIRAFKRTLDRVIE